MASILVVGAGPVGLTAALELKRSGHEVTIIEQLAEISQLSRALGVNARTLELFTPSGFADRLINAGRVIQKAHVWLKDEKKVLIDMNNLEHQYPFILSLPQYKTEGLIEHALSELGVKVQRLTHLEGFTQSDSSIVATVTQNGMENEITANYIIGADGAHSTVRKTLDIGFRGKQYPETWSLADVEMTWPYGDTDANLFILDHGIANVIIPISDNRFRIISNADDLFGSLPKGTTVGNIHWQSLFSVHCRIVDHYQEGRAFLMGDAAHIHSPAGGRGMNLGIEDAFCFVEKLNNNTLQHYNTERRPIGESVLQQTDLLFRGLKTKNPIIKLIRNYIFLPMMNKPAVQRKRLWDMAGLH